MMYIKHKHSGRKQTKLMEGGLVRPETLNELVLCSHVGFVSVDLTQMLSYHRTLTINLSLISHRVRSICKYGPWSSKAYAPADKAHVLTRAQGDAMRVPLLQIWGTGDRSTL